jgi:hypothetical protein
MLVDSMTTVSTPHSVNQSTNRWRSAVKVPKLRTGSRAPSALMAAICMVAPTSMAAAFGCTVGIVRSILDFDCLRFISNPPTDGGRAELRNLFRFLNGIAETASPLSSSRQPMDQVF